jgi:hypothetical protein
MAQKENVTLCIGLTVGVRTGAWSMETSQQEWRPQRTLKFQNEIQYTMWPNECQQNGCEGKAECVMHHVLALLHLHFTSEEVYICESLFSVSFPYTK